MVDEHSGPGPSGEDLGPLEPGDEEEGGKPGVLQESLRRVLIGGASALLTTEEGIRSLIAERRLPKEALSALLSHTDKTRRDLGKLWGGELRSALGRIDIARELRRALSGLRFDVQGSIRIVDESASATGKAGPAEPEAAAAAASRDKDDATAPPPTGANADESD